MKTYQFAIVAIENTEFWNLPEDSTLKDCRIFCNGLFAPGEATYCASLTPSTYVIDMETKFFNRDGSPLSEEQISELDRCFYEYEALDHGYHAFIRNWENNPLVGNLIEIELDLEDYESEEAAREAAWEEAREEARANSGYYEPPLTGIIPWPLAA